MNKKVKKTISLLGLGVFATSLAMNISVTLNNPLSLASNTSLAQTSGGGSSGDCFTAA